MYLSFNLGYICNIAEKERNVPEIMETLVLIPQELSLALRPGGARGREASVSVWTSTELQRGSPLYPFQGTIRIDKLHVYSYVADHDVSETILSLKYNY